MIGYNIDQLLCVNRLVGDIGLLVIDIDGNDYRALESIESAQPRNLIVGYNAMFGNFQPKTIPYDPYS